MPLQNTLSSQLLFVMESIQFLLTRIEEMYRIQVEQESSARKKSVIKIYDKNVDRLPNFKMEQIHISPMGKIEQLLNRLYKHKMVINSSALVKKDSEYEVAKEVNESMVKSMQRMEGRMGVLQEEVRCLGNDVGQLIFLYKQSL